MPTAVALRSLAVNGGAPLHVTVLHDSISNAAKDRIRRSVPEGSIDLAWWDAGHADVGASRATHLSAATYFRIWIAHVLPASVDRVVYLDVDTITRHDLEPLFSIDLGGRTVAAVQSVHFPFAATRGAVNAWRELGLEAGAPYFNAGVMLIDLDRWRSEHVEERALDHLRSGRLGGGGDQEALNVALSGRWRSVPPIWNQQTPMLADDHGAHLIYPTSELEAARTDPAIVHYQTRPKPWHRGCAHPWRGEWLSHAAEVAFDRVDGLRERPLAEEVRWRVRRAASALARGR